MPRLVFLCLLSVLVGGACSSSSSYTPTSAPFVARFDATAAIPAFLDVPFPSDAYLANGRFVTIPGMDRVFRQSAEAITTQLSRTNGWSRIAPAMFAIDDQTRAPNDDTNEPGGARIDRATLPANEAACLTDASAVFVVDLETAERLPCRAVIDDEHDAPSGRTILAVGPARGVVLKEGHRYAVALTDRIKDDGGRALASTTSFQSATRGEGALGSLYAPAYEKVKSLVGSASIVALATYTTQAAEGEIYDLRDQIENLPAPALSWDAAKVAPMGATRFAQTTTTGFTATLDEWLGAFPQGRKLPDGQDDPDEAIGPPAHDKIAALGTAVFDAPSWLRIKPGGYDDFEHATFSDDRARQPDVKIWATFAIPTAPMPAGGYPVVIVQHGLAGSRAYLMTLANRFCAAGWIAVGIDSVTFGARASEARFQVDQGTDYGGSYKGPDGISDVVSGERNGNFDFFGNLRNLLALRDQLRQSELDTATLVRVLRANPDLAPLTTGNSPAPEIDPDRIAYIGDSLGAIEGAVAAAIEPRVKAWTLNVGGGGLLVELAAHGPAINANLALAGSVNFGLRGVPFTEGHPLVTIAQTLAEAGDPIIYAHHIVTDPHPLAGTPTEPRNIFQIEVIYDELVSNESNEALARAGGWGLATPNVGTNAGVADRSGAVMYPTGGITLTTLPRGSVHDTPKPGITAFVAQVSPGHHSADLVRSTGQRQYAIPYNTAQGGLDLQRGDTPLSVPCPYRELQAVMIGFFGDAFTGGKAPVAAGLPAPVRDADGDGEPDSSDPSPIDAHQ